MPRRIRPSSVEGMSDSTLRRAVTPAERRHDAWLAAGMLVAGLISTALGTVSNIYGGNGPALHWGLLYAAAITVPLALRRRFPGTVLVVVSAAF